jgi:hypothetical protein
MTQLSPAAGINNDLIREIAMLRAAKAELVEALEHILDGALSLPRFAEEQARTALANAKGEANS